MNQNSAQLAGAEEVHSLDWLLTSFAKRIADVTYALAVSVDGMTIASSEGLRQDLSDKLSAITSGLASLTVGAATCLNTGQVRQTVVDMDEGVLLIMAVRDRAFLAVVTAPGCDLGQIGYETALLAHRVAYALEPGARTEG
ncbi:roadblock/LC7 domain-containing protein [Catellatospora tritici]|uniref:roadblock/LC7 domain-containing protein n=1 Tax=Catellatospora tritici TaxID=2851566 RepID=UPI001C2DDA0A|nr:roadblock/LC7 domain-containing protein [Catellatospora tritici]MBV1854235.1 roadblock/LC7 domain-containing protein [Catellatospora tritici]